jgi:hypothetical protein
MQLAWNSKTNKIVTIGRGKHPPGVPRLWSVKIKMWNDKAQHELSLRPTKKMLVSDLDPLIKEAFDEFAAEHGPATDASWIATAR